MFNRKKIKISIIKIMAALIITSLSVITTVIAAPIDEVREHIKKDYVEQVPDSLLNVTDIKDMVRGLNDPYSTYLTSQEYSSLTNVINNRFVGIGITVEAVPDGIKVNEVFYGSPAQKAGVKAGDIITEANGKNLAGMTSNDAVNYVKGEEGTMVHIKLIREGSILESDIKRAVVNISTVNGDIIDGKTGYIKISSFGEDTAQEFGAKLKELKASNPESYIVDLRDNGGGYVDTAVDIAGYFIGKKAVYQTVNRWNIINQFNGYEHGDIIDKPVILLVNENSASASEILTAALKDYKKAIVLGRNTFGKGVMQNIYRLSDDSFLKITTRKFVSPLGNVINKVGIAPDYEVTDKKVDELAVAELLTGNSGSSIDKSEYIKIVKDDVQYEINKSKAKQNEYRSAYKYIMQNAIKNDFNIYSGSPDGYDRVGIYNSEELRGFLKPEIDFVGMEHSPLVSGDTQKYYITSKNANKVQYRAVLYNENTETWDELTGGYTVPIDGNSPYELINNKIYNEGKYKLYVYVKDANEIGLHKNDFGDYDSYYMTELNCVAKDDNNRVYVNGDLKISSETVKKNEKINVLGIDNISGMTGPYKYKLNIYDVKNKKWIDNTASYGSNVEWTPTENGIYILDLWVMSSDSSLWSKEQELNGKIYEAWKLKEVIVK